MFVVSVSVCGATGARVASLLNVVSFDWRPFSGMVTGLRMTSFERDIRNIIMLLNIPAVRELDGYHRDTG